MKIKLSPNFFPKRDYLKVVAFDPGLQIGVAHAILIRQEEGDRDVWDVDITTFIRHWPADVGDVVYTDLAAAAASEQGQDPNQ
jgi:hypothetical protein